jgi:beta-glucosidase-like glycosyl hydrolase
MLLFINSIISKTINNLNDYLFINVIIATLPLLIVNQGLTDCLPLQRPLTLEQKIGQLFIIPACQLRGEDHFEDLQKLLSEGKAGGILLKQGTAEGQRVWIERLQKHSFVPLLCVQDGEWGVAMRLSDVISFPKNLTLGAVQDLSLLYQLGQEIGRQCRLVGVHMNLSPVVDVNSNPLNPLIHRRSFGEDPLQVALRGERVMSGMQSVGILACAKHFPGHGDTAVDSHIALPLVSCSRDHLENIELLPFRWLIRSGVKSLMSAHLCVDALVESPLLPATFSKRIITTLLQKEMGFQGLILSDALNMKALTCTHSAGQIALGALLAGHDMLLYGDHLAPNIDQILKNDLPEAFARVRTAVKNREISEEEIDQRVRKILQAKRELGLFESSPRSPDLFDLSAINSPKACALKERLYEEAITVVRNESMLPLKPGKIALIEWGESPFFNTLIQEKFETEVLCLTDPQLLTKLHSVASVIITLSTIPDLYDPQKDAILHILAKSSLPIALVLFETPYSLARLPSFPTVVIAYENEKGAQEAAAKVVLGSLSPKGKLPVSVKPHFEVGAGLFW